MKPYFLGLIGHPLEHSLSPGLHGAALQAAGLPGEYHLYPVAPLPEGAGRLDDLLARLRRGEIHGLNVTVPHKQSVIQWLDDLSPVARTIGAANTLYAIGGRLVGDNTDSAGFSKDLKAFWSNAYSRELNPADLPRRAMILGAGGSARAVAYALLVAGWHVILTSRRFTQASHLVSDLHILVKPQQQFTPVEFNPQGLAPFLPDLDLLVNTTPLGMWPDVDSCPWLPEMPLPARSAVYDLVYNPAQTALLRAAQARGLPAANGLGMLVEQAALAFECWTGLPAARNAMRQSLTAFLEGDAS